MSRFADELLPEILRLREQGCGWSRIAEILGLPAVFVFDLIHDSAALPDDEGEA
jgi:hypothetical protein